jgi:hypothetical protein
MALAIGVLLLLPCLVYVSILLTGYFSESILKRTVFWIVFIWSIVGVEVFVFGGFALAYLFLFA